GEQHEQVGGGKHLSVKKDHVEKIEGNMLLLVGGDGGNQDVVIKATKKERVEKNSHLHVQGKRNEKIDGNASLTIMGERQEKVDKKYALDVTTELHLKAQKIVIQADQELTLVQKGNFIKLDAAGVTIVGTPEVLVNSGGSPGEGSGANPEAAEEAAEA